MKALFVGHKFHKITRSSDFFVDVLRERYEVERAYVNTGSYRLDDPIFETDADLIVVWQLEFWALGFLNRGKRVVVVPMYDGSGSRPELHWQLFRDAHFVNFSLTLHHAIESAGATSFLLKYFPEPKERSLRFDTLDAFFWERRPRSGLTVETVNRLMGRQLDSLHVHFKADPGEPEREMMSLPADLPFRLTKSQWFDNKRDLEHQLTASNLYMAPRLTEGIGMGFLEAMAHGLVVIAQDFPTHSEYIANWINGILVDVHSTESVQLGDRVQLHEIATNALESVAMGHADWRAALPLLYDYLESIPKPAIETGFFETGPFDELAAVATQENTHYIPVLSDYCDQHPALSKLNKESLSTKFRRRPHLPEIEVGQTLYTTHRRDESFLASGWDRSDAKGTWSRGTRGELVFKFEQEAQQDALTLTLWLRTLLALQRRKTRYEIRLNGLTLAELELKDDFDNYSIRVPAAAMNEGLNVLTIKATDAATLPGRMFKTAFALQKFKLDDSQTAST